MKNLNYKDSNNSIIIFIILVIISSYSLFYFSYNLDNRYNFDSPKASKGFLILDEDNLVEKPYFFLVEGWEIYRDKLYKPQDFINRRIVPDEYVFIGQYGGFEGHINSTSNVNSHGSATYRLNIKLPSTEKNYTLELSEIFSSYNLFINGELFVEMGDPDPDNYVSKTKYSKVSFRAADRLEIIFNVTDFDYIYSGIVNPPLFGLSQPVDKLLNMGLAIRYISITLATTIAIFNLIIYFLLKDNENSTLQLFYFVLSFCYAVYISYPILKTIFDIGIWFYILKNCLYLFILLIIVIIQNNLTKTDNIYSHGVVALGIFTTVFGIMIHILNHSNYKVVLGYSKLLTIYLWIVAIYLFVTSFYSKYNNINYYKSMLIGEIVFAVSLIFDRVYNLFQPILFGFFSEIAGLIFIFSIGSVVLSQISSQFRLRLLLTNKVDNATNILKIQKVLYPIIMEKESEIKKINHDLRHHMLIIHEFIVDENYIKLKDYVDNLSKSTSIDISESFSEHYVSNLILRSYDKLAKMNNIKIFIKSDIPSDIDIDDIDLCVILSNLLENSLNASLKIPEEKREIHINIKYKMNNLGILIKNAYDGIIKKNIGTYMQNKSDLSIGIISVKTICEKYNGNLNLSSDHNFFQSEVFLPLNRKDE